MNHLQKKEIIVLSTLYALLILIFYFPVFSSEFVLWDDYDLITNNPYVKNINFVELWTNWNLKSFFPFAVMTYSLEHSLFGMSSKAFHSINLIIHILNTFLFMYLLRLMLPISTFGIALGGAILALHPANVEIVAWASAQRDLICISLIFISLIYYIKYVPKSGLTFKNYLVLTPLSILAMGFKPIAITLPGFFFTLDYLKSKENIFSKVTCIKLFKQIPFVVVLAPFIAYEVISQKVTVHVDNVQYTPIEGLTNVFNSLAFHFSKFILPIENIIIYDSSFFSIQSLDYVIPVLGLAVGYFAYRKDKTLKYILTAGLLFYFVRILPVSKIIPFGNSDYNMRYLYLGSLGLFIYVYFSLSVFFKKNAKLQWSFLLLLIAAMGITTFKQSKVWNNEVSLWQHVLNYYPKSGRAYNQIGYYYLNKRDFQTAVPYLEKAYQYAGQLRIVRSNLAYAYGITGSHDKAHEIFKYSYNFDKSNIVLLNNMASNLLQMGRFNEAKRYFLEALQVNPQYLPSLIGASQTYLKLDKKSLAKEYLLKAQRLQPQNQYVNSQLQELQ